MSPNLIALAIGGAQLALLTGIFYRLGVIGTRLDWLQERVKTLENKPYIAPSTMAMGHAK